MLRVLSTHLFLKQRLHTGMLELAARSGAQAVEIFAARQHFDYTSREHVGELADWFRSNPLQAWSMHAPLYPDRESGRAGAPAVNLLHPEKSRRIHRSELSSMVRTTWCLATPPAADDLNAISSELGVPEPVARILWNRQLAK